MKVRRLLRQWFAVLALTLLTVSAVQAQDNCPYVSGCDSIWYPPWDYWCGVCVYKEYQWYGDYETGQCYVCSGGQCRVYTWGCADECAFSVTFQECLSCCRYY
jgi:hypothetical protein